MVLRQGPCEVTIETGTVVSCIFKMVIARVGFAVQRASREAFTGTFVYGLWVDTPHRMIYEDR